MDAQDVKKRPKFLEKISLPKYFNKSKKYSPTTAQTKTEENDKNDETKDGTVSEAASDVRETWGGKLDFFLSALGYAGLF